MIDFLSSGAATAIITNPIWVVKVRMFTTEPTLPGSYRNLWRQFFSLIEQCISSKDDLDGLYTVARTEGYRGLWRGTILALFGVSNGALQFMTYEEMKKWGFAQKRLQMAKAGLTWTPSDDRLVKTISLSQVVAQALNLTSQTPPTLLCRGFPSCLLWYVLTHIRSFGQEHKYVQ